MFCKCYLFDGEIKFLIITISAKKVMLSSTLVSELVCLSAGLHKTVKTISQNSMERQPWKENRWILVIQITHRRRSRGAEGTFALPTCRQGGKRYQVPPFRRLSGMIACKHGKHRHYKWKCVKYYQKCVKFACNYFKKSSALDPYRGSAPGPR